MWRHRVANQVHALFLTLIYLLSALKINKGVSKSHLRPCCPDNDSTENSSRVFCYLKFLKKIIVDSKPVQTLNCQI